MDVSQSCNSTTTRPFVCFSLILPTRLSERVSQRFRKSKGTQTPVVDASPSFGCCSSSVYSSDQISQFQSLFDQEPYIGIDWTLSQSLANDGTFPFDGVESSGTHSYVMSLAHDNDCLFIHSFTPPSLSSAISSINFPLMSGRM